MSDLLTDIDDKVCLITLNRVSKHNAFDDKLLNELQILLSDAIKNPHVRTIILKANGKHFSAGADLEWMQRMSLYNEEENIADAMVLAELMHTLYKSIKPTIAMVHGAAYGGGAGLAAACDIAIAADNARFCFSEVKLGLIPAVISPYVVKAIGERAAKDLFMTADIFDAKRAKELGLVQHCVLEDELHDFTLAYAHKIAHHAPAAVGEAKQLASTVADKEITKELINYTAELIARKRVSQEGQDGLNAFINKKTPNWK
ncbi:enoyl-CoA hydratase-related protein [Legionella israelensis]|uniref:Enoyl CoA hydratase/isomerase (Crotonase) n=1 Tax=Legionella israelensis TaxID=454 RepID=A0A0W0V7F0_9GAMM|nr:enoyl-CoA hydratase-related protein [Legionella israelensis]KTD16043.1 enoyl CoA hydratase/isomerase (crotonase) [Legionella israelensis]QBS08842.1 gamma-carboxygeranoyl-CoA hydratase [Legionella israelensis]SCY05059.1 short chain enoyl-CoA hydratase [Legionella israelensis DSM 19235]STX58524.1 enoyl CoA hydratase/isomerase (crotonase) [Legionella israelensis]